VIGCKTTNFWRKNREGKCICKCSLPIFDNEDKWGDSNDPDHMDTVIYTRRGNRGMKG